jgi:hypothetical protein
MSLWGIKASRDGLKNAKASEWILRFIFGGLISATAGLIGQKYGVVVGGLFLAFPSILPATVTLINEYDGWQKAAEDTRGAAFGSIGLLIFTLVVALTLEKWGIAASLGAATGVWAVCSTLIWKLTRRTQGL